MAIISMEDDKVYEVIFDTFPFQPAGCYYDKEGEMQQHLSVEFIDAHNKRIFYTAEIDNIDEIKKFIQDYNVFSRKHYHNILCVIKHGNNLSIEMKDPSQWNLYYTEKCQKCKKEFSYRINEIETIHFCNIHPYRDIPLCSECLQDYEGMIAKWLGKRRKRNEKHC